MNYIYLDTSSLMHSPEAVELEIMKEDTVGMVCSVVMDELDKHKDFGDGERNYQARQALKLINKLSGLNKFVFTIDETVPLPGNYDMNIPDNKILACLLYNMKKFKCNDYKLLTYDNGMKAKANLLGISVLELIEEDQDRDYKGYIEISGTEEELDEQLEKLLASNKLMTNQYIIMNQEEDSTINVYTARWTGTELVDTYDPKKSKTPVKPLNGPQQCAIDLLYNKDIPVKIIAGNFGSGKTMLSVKIAEDMIFGNMYQTLMLVRNPVPAEDIDIGALPGSKHDKVGGYFKSMTQYLTDYSNGFDDSFDPDNEMAAKQRGYELIMEIPSFMKGISVIDTIMIVDECEDLNVKLVKMLGTRIGKNSSIVFTGDYKQSEKKYKLDSGMNKMIEAFKGEPLVGIVVLDEDVRSSVSKIFANLDN